MNSIFTEENLLAFTTAARFGSFSKAAEELGLTTSAISYTIKRMETGLDVVLFTRSTRSIELTESGRYFFRKATDLLNDFHAIKRGIDTISQGIEARVRICINQLLYTPRHTARLLQVLGHLVEAAGQLAEFIVAFHCQAHAEIALLHALHAQAQSRDGFDDEHEHQVNHADRADDGHADENQLRGAQPEGALLAIVLDQAHQLVDLADEGYDIALRITREPGQNLVARQLAPIRRKICASPAYLARRGIPLAPEDLVLHNCLDYTFMNTQGVWHLNGYNGDVSIPVSGTLRINDDEALSQAVLGGLGLALLPRHAVRLELAQGLLRQLPVAEPLVVFRSALIPSFTSMAKRLPHLPDCPVH